MIQTDNHFIQGVFGMNIEEINPGTLGTLPHYFATTIPLTVLTTWIIVALQGKWNEAEGDNISIWEQLKWPVKLLQQLIKKKSPSQTPTRKIQNGAV